MNTNKTNNNMTYFINNNMKINNTRNNNNDANNSGEYENHNIVLLELTRQNSSRPLVPRMGNSRHQYNNSHEIIIIQKIIRIGIKIIIIRLIIIIIIIIIVLRRNSSVATGSP